MWYWSWWDSGVVFLKNGFWYVKWDFKSRPTPRAYPCLNHSIHRGERNRVDLAGDCMGTDNTTTLTRTITITCSLIFPDNSSCCVSYYIFTYIFSYLTRSILRYWAQIDLIIILCTQTKIGFDTRELTRECQRKKKPYKYSLHILIWIDWHRSVTNENAYIHIIYMLSWRPFPNGSRRKATPCIFRDIGYDYRGGGSISFAFGLIW